MKRAAFGAPSIVWKTRLWSEGSSAIISREMILALDRLGYHIAARNLDPGRTDCTLLGDPTRRARLRQLERAGRTPGEAYHVRCSAPDASETHLIEGAWDVAEEARGNIAFLTLPYGYLPEGARPETANRLLSQVWGCSAHVVETLVEIGFDPAKVYRVPLGYAPDVFHPGVRPAALATSKRFRFIHVSIPLILTKGIDLLVRAYVREFTQADDTCLVLQSRPRAGGEDALKELIEHEMRAASHRPEILLLATGADQPTLASWYAASSCYVQTSRCEGFGMPVLEAMACGLPAIATNWGGHLEMCTPDTSYRVDCAIVDPPDGAEAEGVTSVRKWAAPDVEQIRHWMRHAYEHPDETRERGRFAAGWVRERLTWAHAAQQAIDVLRAHEKIAIHE